MGVRLQAELFLKRAGWPPIAGLVLACSGLAALHGWLPAQEKRLARVEQEYRRTLAQVTAPSPAVAIKAPSSLLHEREAAFYATLPQRAKAPELIRTVFAQAQKVGLSLAQAEYRMGEDKNGGYIAYQMVLPVKGPYVKLREFIEGVLVEIPCASLEEIAFKRESIGAASSDARLRFVFYLKDGAT
jgi:Tfp pilus assembly protein PilO